MEQKILLLNLIRWNILNSRSDLSLFQAPLHHVAIGTTGALHPLARSALHVSDPLSLTGPQLCYHGVWLTVSISQR